MASTSSASGDNASSGGCTTPNSNPNYDSDSKSDCVEEPQLQEDVYHHCLACRQALCDPRVLDCLHSYCLYCLKGLEVVSHERPSEVQCMKCGATSKLETGTLSLDTTVDYGRRRYIENLTFNDEDNLICRSCKQGNKAIARCYECAMFLCDMCTPQHSKLHCYADHHVISLHDTFKQPAREVRFCSAHLEDPHPATMHCYICRTSFCEAAHHQYQNPSHKVVSLADAGNFQEMMFSIRIEENMAQSIMNEYSSGIKRMHHCHNTFMSDLQNAKTELISKIEKRFEVLEQTVIQHKAETAIKATELFKSYFAYCQRLRDLFKFMEAQGKYALPWDNLQTRPFIEKILKKINDSKPAHTQLQQMLFDFELSTGNLDEVAACLGSIQVRQPPTDQIITGYQQQQQPIARPTSTNRSSSNQNYGGMDGYQNGQGNYRQYNSYNQQSQPAQSYRSSTSSQSSDMNQMGYFGYDQQSQQRNSYDQFSGQTYQQTSSSPMTVSQPNSATLASDTVFDFNLQLEGTNANFSAGYSTAQNQNRLYSTWSNGVDQPGSSVATSQADDIFTRSSMFQVPEGSGNPGRSFSSFRRVRMQFISKFGEYGNAPGQFTEPSGVAIDAHNHLIVADTNNNRIQVFNIHGEFLSQFGGMSVNTKMTYPNRIAVSKKSGRVVITERAPSHRVQTYTLDGRHLNTFGEEVLQHPRGVAVDKDDNILIIECKVMRLTIFTMDGDMKAQFSLSKDLQFPNSVAVNDKQEIFISDNRSHNVKVFSYEGELLRTIGQEGLTNYPIAVAINQRGQVVVADNHNNFNITVFEQDGTLVAGYESKTKHAQCFDLTVTGDGLAVLTSKDFKVYCYPYMDDCPYQGMNRR